MQFQMGIIKVKINIREAIKAIEEFRENRTRALESITHDLKEAVSRSLNHLLNAEMTLFLGQPDQSSNKRNGTYERTYALKGVGAVRIKMPRDRKAEFKSSVIPAHEQMDPRLKEDMAVLHLAGISTRMLAMMSRRVLGIEVIISTIISMQLTTVKSRNILSRTVVLILVIILTSFSSFADEDSERLLKRDINEINRAHDEILKRLPLDQYEYVWLGRSPTPIEARFEIDGYLGIKIPFSLVVDWSDVEAISHLQNYLPEKKALNGRKLLVIDFVDSGASLTAVQQWIHSFYKVQGAVDVHSLGLIAAGSGMIKYHNQNSRLPTHELRLGGYLGEALTDHEYKKFSNRAIHHHRTIVDESYYQEKNEKQKQEYNNFLNTMGKLLGRPLKLHTLQCQEVLI